MPLTVYVLNDNVLYVLGLQNQVSAAYINNATVTARLKTKGGANASDSLTLTALGSAQAVTIDGKTYPDGNYYVMLEEDLDLENETTYYAFVDADAGGDLKAHWELPVRATKRTS